MQLGTRSAIFFPLLLLLLLAVITFWINKTVQPPVPRIDGSSRHDPDYIMTNFVTTQTDENGDLRYKLAATEMRHFPDDDSTELQRPRYTQFAVGKPYTQVEGLRGYVSSNGEEVQLVGNVKVTRQAFAGKGEMTVEADYLNIRPNDELVTTESPVIIRQAPKTVIHATGMIYDKKKQTVTLLRKVRAHYERPASSGSRDNVSAKSVKNGASKSGSGKAATSKPDRVKKKTAGANTVASKKKVTKINDGRTRRRYE